MENLNDLQPSKAAQFDGLKMEYAVLHEEILKRVEMRAQILFGTLTIAGVLFSFGLSNPPVAFVYPIVAAFLAVFWAQNDIRIRLASRYIRERIESQVSGLGWERYRLNEAYYVARIGPLRFTVLSASGAFITTQLVAVFIGFSQFATLTVAELVFGLLSLVLTFVTILLLWVAARRSDTLEMGNETLDS